MKNLTHLTHFLLVAAVLMIAASFLSGCMHRYSVCIPTQQGNAMCRAGYTKAQAYREWRTLDFFTDPEVVLTPKHIDKQPVPPSLPSDYGKPTDIVRPAPMPPYPQPIACCDIGVVLQ